MMQVPLVSSGALCEISDNYIYCMVLFVWWNTLIMHCGLSKQIEHGHRSSQQDLLTDYCDGSAYQSHASFSVNFSALQIYLYYDDLELYNLLASVKA